MELLLHHAASVLSSLLSQIHFTSWTGQLHNNEFTQQPTVQISWQALPKFSVGVCYICMPPSPAIFLILQSSLPDTTSKRPVRLLPAPRGSGRAAAVELATVPSVPLE